MEIISKIYLSLLDCVLWTNVAESTSEYCKIGDLVGVKGRLQTRMITKEDGTKYKKVEIIAERVTFLTSKNSHVNNLEEDNDDLVIDDLGENKCKKNARVDKKKN